MKIQRGIERFNKTRKVGQCEVRSFNVVPIFTFRRQHIRIDKDVFYHNLSALKMLTRVHGTININKDEFRVRFEDEIKKLIDVDKIKKIGGKKKTFEYQILTDGVSATILYTKTDKENSEKVKVKGLSPAQKRKKRNPKESMKYEKNSNSVSLSRVLIGKDSTNS